ncbi:MAG: VOC family protein [Acidimicrobiales bacterium]
MTAIVRTFTFDTLDPYAQAQFWSQVLGTGLDPEDAPGDPAATVSLGDGRPPLLFEQVPDAKSVKNRLHLDLEPQQPRDHEVDRLLGIGATPVDDRRRTDGTGWVVLADPEGNEFCVLMSAEERARLQP